MKKIESCVENRELEIRTLQKSKKLEKRSNTQIRKIIVKTSKLVILIVLINGCLGTVEYPYLGRLMNQNTVKQILLFLFWKWGNSPYKFK